MDADIGDIIWSQNFSVWAALAYSLSWFLENNCLLMVSHVMAQALSIFRASNSQRMSRYMKQAFMWLVWL